MQSVFSTSNLVAEGGAFDKFESKPHPSCRAATGARHSTRAIATIVAVLAILSGCASVGGRERAVDAHMADLGSTAVGLAMGAAEANPLGLALIPLKAWQMQQIAKIQDTHLRAEAYSNTAAVVNGATANNLCVISALAFPPLVPVAGVLCPLIGVSWAAKEYSANKDPERAYAAFCEEWKKERPGNTCQPYTQPGSLPDRSVQAALR